MFTLTVQDHIMIAHSLPNQVFGPAQQLHGATYTVQAEFSTIKLDKTNLVIDIGLAGQMLQEVLKPLQYANLDEVPDLKGQLTTTEFMASYIHSRLAERLKSTFSGDLKITLHESPVAWASYSGKVG